MASIVAYIELREGAITSPSRFVVAEARRIADSAGATVFALLTVGPLAQVEMDTLASEISAAGADRILCSSADTLDGPALDATHGAILAQVAEHLRPLLFLFPSGGTGAQLAPPLAVRMGAAHLVNATITVCAEDRVPDAPSQRVLLSRWRAAGDGQRVIDVGDLERPVVASLVSGPFPPSVGKPYAEVEMDPCPDAKVPDARVVDSHPDADGGLELCRAVVLSAKASAASTDALRARLPDGVGLASTNEFEPAARETSLLDVFVLPSAWSELGTNLFAPGTNVLRIESDARSTAKSPHSKDETESGDVDLAEFAAALDRARSRGGQVVIVLVCLESPSPSPASRAALRLASTLGDKTEVVVISAGGAPDSPSFALARQTGAVRRVVHLQDSALVKPDFLTLGMVLAEAARHLQAGVVVTGEHSDGEGQGMVPAALAHHLRAPIFARVQSAEPATEVGILRITVRSGGRLCHVVSPLPVVLSTPALKLGDEPTETRPSSPAVETLSLAQLGVDASRLVPRPNLLGTLVPVQRDGIPSKSFDEAAHILLRGR